jgi:hypothetical protein
MLITLLFTVCVHYKPPVDAADIFYSFDCANVTDEVTGTYNGFPAILSRTDLSVSIVFQLQ